MSGEKIQGISRIKDALIRQDADSLDAAFQYLQQKLIDSALQRQIDQGESFPRDSKFVPYKKVATLDMLLEEPQQYIEEFLDSVRHTLNRIKSPLAQHIAMNYKPEAVEQLEDGIISAIEKKDRKTVATHLNAYENNIQEYTTSALLLDVLKYDMLEAAILTEDLRFISHVATTYTPDIARNNFAMLTSLESNAEQFEVIFKALDRNAKQDFIDRNLQRLMVGVLTGEDVVDICTCLMRNAQSNLTLNTIFPDMEISDEQREHLQEAFPTDIQMKLRLSKRSYAHEEEQREHLQEAFPTDIQMKLHLSKRSYAHEEEQRAPKRTRLTRTGTMEIIQPSPPLSLSRSCSHESLDMEEDHVTSLQRTQSGVISL